MKTRYTRYERDLHDICYKKGWKTEVIGYVGRRSDCPIYKLVMEAKNNKRGNTVSFVAGVHGNEVSGPLSMQDFIKQHNQEPWMPRIVIIPVANPTGFDRDIYRSEKQENINRGYLAPVLYEERAMLLATLLKERPEYFVSFHEDDIKKTIYLYGYSERPDGSFIFRKILDEAGRYCTVDSKSIVYNHKSVRGLIFNAAHDGSLEDRMRIEGIPYVMCMEVPDHSSLAVRVKTNISVMRSVISLSATAK
ncbi:MAG: succinylglutamate desuccinylase/aspartoacylase family protein [Patescibacteria group bacterium]